MKQDKKEVNRKKPVISGEELAIERGPDGKIKPGSRLNPAGRPKGILSWTGMLKKVIEEDYAVRGDGTKVSKLEAVAKKLIELSIQGEVQAIRELGDRLEGKPKQTVEGDLKLTLSSLREKYIRKDD